MTRRSRRTVDAAQELLDAGPALVALGSEAGNLFIWRDGHLLVPKIDVPVVDNTGGGDALTAALAVSLLRGDAPQDAAVQAVAAATVTIGHAAGRPSLNRGSLHDAREQIDERMRSEHG